MIDLETPGNDLKWNESKKKKREIKWSISVWRESKEEEIETENNEKTEGTSVRFENLRLN